MTRILVVGHLTLDVLCNAVDRYASFFVPQGAALGSACGVLVNGGVVDIISVVGDDYPAEILASLQHAGAGLGHLFHRPGPSLRFWILRETRRTCVDHPFSSMSIWDYTPVPPGPSVSFGAYAAAHICPMPLKAQSAWLRRLRGEVPLLSLDPQPFRYAAADALPHQELDGLLHDVDILSISTEDFPDLSVGSTSGVLSAWLSRGPQIVTLKMGARGAAVGMGGCADYIRLPATSTRVHDETGAGDSFAGAFLTVYAATRDPESAGVRASRTAGRMISEIGMIHLLSPLEESRPEDRGQSRHVRLDANDSEVCTCD